MRNILLATLAGLTAITANAGCIPFGCGGFSGGGNQAFEREGEMLLICENGGFVATLSDKMIEGRYEGSSDGGIGRRGEDGTVAFELYVNGGFASTTQLGDATWTKAELDIVAMDHADVLCTDLTARAWWSGSDGRAAEAATAIKTVE